MMIYNHIVATSNIVFDLITYKSKVLLVTGDFESNKNHILLSYIISI
jgi:hypothetical protein